MDTNDAERLMRPFFPHEPYLAAQSLSKAMSTDEGVQLPEWIWQVVVKNYFTYLQMQRIEMKNEQLRDQLKAADSFKMGTLPYMLMDFDHFNLN